MKAEARRPEIHALIVGINFYRPQQVLEAPAYPSLGGCVHDALGVRDFLLRTGAVEENIELLTATGTLETEDTPREPPGRRPTHSNLVAALERLVERAAPGHQIVLHYSGHGGLAETRSEAKRRQGFTKDECLVPMDIGEGPHVPYLRDWELATLVRRMVDKKAFVTLLLDCCHSGGLTRGQHEESGQLRSRGTHEVDPTERPLSPLRESAAGEVAAVVSRAVSRGGEGGTWGPKAEGYALLAACGPHQKAMEAVFSGTRSSGAMTYWLLDALATGGRMSYRELHQRLLGLIHTHFPSQTPVLEGGVDRAFLGLETIPVLHGAGILRREDDPGGLLLETGSLHAVGQGARFAVYPSRMRTVAELEDAEPTIIRLTQVRAHRSSAEVVQRAQQREPHRRIQVGDRAVLLDTGTVSLIHPVRLIEAEGQADKMVGLRRCLRGQELRFVTLDEAAGGKEAGFEVRLDAEDRYLLCSGDGVPLPDVSPPTDPETAVLYLNHLARFRNIQGLRHTGRETDLRENLKVRCWRRPADWRQDDFTPPERVDVPRELALNECLYFEVANGGSRDLYLTILDLQPGWSIEQVHPPRRSGALFEVLGSGETLSTWLRMYLPRSFERPVDTFKVVAAEAPFNLRPIELPELGKVYQFRDALRGTAGSLQGFVESMAAAPPPVGRHGEPPDPSENWMVKEVEVRVVGDEFR